MWFYAKGDEQHGPVSTEELRERIKSGSVGQDELVWKEGLAQWTPVGQVLELREPVAASSEGVAPAAQSSGGGFSQIGPSAGGGIVPGSAYGLNPPVQQNGLSLVSMILGICSFVLCLGALTGLLAVIFGHIGLKQIRNSPTPQGGEGMAKTGLILGYLSIILTIVVFVLAVFGAWVEASEAAEVVSPAP